MIWNGAVLAMSVASYKIPNLGLPELLRYVPLVVSGVLIILFSDRAPDRARAGSAGGALVALTILCISFFGLLVLGVPVAFAIGLSALCTILYEGLPLAVLFQQMMSGMKLCSPSSPSPSSSSAAS